MKKIFNYIMLFAVALSGLTLTACKEDELDTNQYGKGGVNILVFGPMPITRGETLKVTGTQLNKVKEVLFPEGNQKVVASTTYINGDFTVNSPQELVVTIPDQCVPGRLSLVTYSGDTIVSSSNLSFAEEIKVDEITPLTIHPGAIITIKGEYVWNIADVTFSAGKKVSAASFVKNTRKEIEIRVPMDAVSGPVTYSDGSVGAESKVITNNLIVDTVSVSGISNATPEFGDEITIYGENLDLVSQLDFPSVANVPFQVANDGKSITVKVPGNAVSGFIALTSYSGITNSVEVTLPLATVESITPNEELKAGDVVTITGTLLDRITSVKLPGDIILESGKFTQTATQITFAVPEEMGDGKVVLIQHENYSVETPKITMHHEGAETPIWQGNVHVGNWNGSMNALSWGGYDWSTVKAGQILTVYLTPDMSEGWSQIRIANGNWAALPGTSDVNELTAEDTKISVTLTQAMIDDLVNNGGLVLCGAYFTVTKVTLSVAEETIWSGNHSAGGWAKGFTEFSWDGYNAIKDKMKAGAVLTFYFIVDPAKEYGCQIRFANGNWSALPGTKSLDGADGDGNISMADDATSYQLRLTQEMVDEMANNGGLVLCGAWFILNKITIQ